MAKRPVVPERRLEILLRDLARRIAVLERRVTRRRIGVRVSRANTGSILNGDVHQVSWSLADWDSDGAWDSGSATIITIPVTGVWLLTAHCRTNSAASGSITVTVTTPDRVYSAPSGEDSAGLRHTSLSFIAGLSEGDEVTCTVTNSTGVTRSLNVEMALHLLDR